MHQHGHKERMGRYEELRAGIEAFCTLCLKTMGFPVSAGVDAPVRFKNGASYDGTGQT